MFRMLLVLVALLTAAGCAGSRTAAPPPPDHPGSSEASVAPLPEPSNVLATHDPLRPSPADGEHQHVGPGAEDHVLGPSEGRAGHPGPDHSAHGEAASPPEVTGSGATAPEAPGAQALYVCPMHPEVTSDKPGRCRKCNMKLVQQAKPGEQR